VWALGLRNSFGLAFHPHTGDLWESENGPESDDEVNRIVRGGNYGWPNVTGIVPGSTFVNPIVEFTPTIAPTGIVALGDHSAYPADFDDDLILADYNTGRIRRLVLGGPRLDTLERVETLFAGGPAGSIFGVEVGPDGFVYVSTSGAIHRLVPASAGGVQLTGVQVTSITPTTATLVWTTNVAADSQVEFGTTLEYGLLTPPDPTPVTSHSVTLGGLQPGVTYHVRARSRLTGQSPTASADLAFTTVNTGTIQGVAFEDLDGDGTRDAGEAGLAGWTIELDLGNDASVNASTVTGADGTYSFTSIVTGTHAVREVVPAGWLQTAPPGGVYVVTLAPGDVASGRDFGDVRPGSISGIRFEDVDGDGVHEDGEPAVAGGTVFLDTDRDGVVDPGEPSALSDATGSYTFANLLPGTYAVTEVLPAGWIQTAPSAAGSATTALTASAAGLTLTGSTAALLTPAETVSEALTIAAGPVGGDGLTNLTAFRADPRFAGIDGHGLTAVVIDTGIDLDHPFFGADADHNGVADRIVFQWDFADGDADASDRDGHGSSMASIIASQDASVGGVAPGVDLIALKIFEDATRRSSFAYLEQALQWVIGHLAAYDIAVVNVSLGDGANWTTAGSHYGIDDELALLAGRGVVVAAPAGNGFFTAGSAPGVSYPAADPNALAIGAVWAADFGGPWTSGGGAMDLTTAPDRVAAFSQRDALLTDVFAPGARLTGANQSGGTVTMQGTSQATAYVSGVTVLAQQLAEETLGRRLTVAELTDLLRRTGHPVVDGDDENDNVVNTGLTFPRVDLLALGDAILALGAGPGPLAEPGAPPARLVTLAAGESRGDVDFGSFRLGEIRGSVFHDLDVDGTRDPGDPFVAGWTVFLDQNGNGTRDPLEPVAVTDGQGRYAFTAVGPGRVRPSAVVQPLWVQTGAPTPGEIVVTSGLTVTDRDFGAVRISLDVDGNGRAEAVTDGRLLYRVLSGVADAQAVAGTVIASGAPRSAPATIRAFLDAAAGVTPTMLDADGDGAATTLDGQIILRFLAGTPPTQLLTGLTLGPTATRTTAAAIVDHLDDFLPALPAAPAAASADAAAETTAEMPRVAAAVVAAELPAPTVPAPLPPIVPSAAARPDPLIDWSRAWGSERRARPPRALLEFTEDDANSDLRVELAVLAER
jgi:subtilisin family serine protease